MSLLEMAYRPSPQANLDTSVHEALANARPTGCDAVSVVEGGRLTGILTAHDAIRKVLQAGLNPRTTLVGSVMTKDPRVLLPESSAHEAISVMATGDFRHLPLVQRDGVLAGMLSLRKMVRTVLAGLPDGTAASSLPSLLDASYNPVTTVTPEHPIQTVIDQMARASCDAVLVKRKDWIIGIVTIHDLINKLLLAGRNPEQTLVGDMMNAPVMTLRPQATALDAVNLMLEWNVRHIPLSTRFATVDGMLSMRKLLLHLAGTAGHSGAA